MNEDQFDVEFVPSGRGKARCAPNPEYPIGMDVDIAGTQASCTATIPYPSPECGVQVVRCRECGTSVLLTVAGRADDPKSVRMPCKFFRLPG